jgi:gliding motility-associated-like protein
MNYRKLLCYLLFVHLFHSESDAQIIITNSDDTICGGSVTLSAQVLPFEIITNKTDVYTFDPIQFAPEPPGGTFVNLSDDANTGALPIGFTFKFFDVEYTQFYISSNGWIGFSPGQTTAFTSAQIPSTASNVPKNCIMGPWQDWHPGVGSNIGQYISYRTEGIAPCRRLIVTYNQIPFFSCTTTLGTFQIILYETTNAIENHITAKPSCLTWANGTATQGVHNAAGTIAYTAPGRNSTQWEAYNEGTSFVAIGEPSIEQVNFTVTWFANGTPVGTGLQINHTPTSNPTQYVAEVNYGCGNQSFFDTVMIYLVPFDFELSTNRASCEGSPDGSASVNIVSGETGPYNFVWKDEQGNILLSTPNIADSTGIANQVSGNYTVEISDSFGCQAELNFSISILQAELQLSATDAICPQSPTGTVSVEVDGVSPPFTYQWTTGATFVSANQTAPQVFSGTYQVTVGYGIGCEITDSIVVGQPEFVYETATFPATCFGVPDGSASVLVTTGTGPFTYFWFPGDFNTATVQNMNSGLYILTITDGNGCLITDSVIVPGPPQIVFDTISAPATCAEANGSASVLNPAGGNGAPFTFLWSNDETSSAVSDLAPGDYTVTVTDANGCSQSADINVGEIPNPEAAFSINPPNVAPNNVPVEFTDLSSSTASNIIAWEWQFGNAGESNQQNPVVSFPEAGQYEITLIVETDAGCFDTVTVVYEISGDIEVPNVFTPNGDGFNDFFEIPNIQFIKGNKVLVMNRWGRKVFEASDYNNDTVKWDGGDSPSGTYFYIIDVPEKEQKKGAVTLIRK